MDEDEDETDNAEGKNGRSDGDRVREGGMVIVVVMLIRGTAGGVWKWW